MQYHNLPLFFVIILVHVLSLMLRVSRIHLHAVHISTVILIMPLLLFSFIYLVLFFLLFYFQQPEKCIYQIVIPDVNQQVLRRHHIFCLSKILSKNNFIYFLREFHPPSNLFNHETTLTLQNFIRKKIIL